MPEWAAPVHSAPQHANGRLPQAGPHTGSRVSGTSCNRMVVRGLRARCGRRKAEGNGRPSANSVLLLAARRRVYNNEDTRTNANKTVPCPRRIVPTRRTHHGPKGLSGRVISSNGSYVETNKSEKWHSGVVRPSSRSRERKTVSSQGTRKEGASHPKFGRGTR